MLFQGKDGELRMYDHGLNGTTYYLEVLFTDMNFSGPISRPRTEERLIMDRGNFDTNAHYVESNDEPRYAPFAITFSCKMADTVHARVINDWLSGDAKVGGSTTLYTRKGKTTLDGNTLPTFKESNKMAYDIEVLWDGTSDYGLHYYEVFFKPNECTITEAEDGITLSVNADVYGDTTRITAFSAGKTSII